MITEKEVQKALHSLKSHPLLSQKFCDNCGGKHEDGDVQVLPTDGSHIAIRQSCSNCDLVQIMRLIPNGQMSVQRFESNNSDVNGQELNKFAGEPSVEQEEILEVYAQMREVHSIKDFLKLIEE